MAAQTDRPQPRVAYEMHSAEINMILATPDFSRLLSVSQDKTLRVWRMADLRLLRTIRVPSDPGEEGSLRALVVTPDGREALVGGWTGMGWSGQGQIYRFDLATGQLLQTYRGFAANIEKMAISADGKRLAVGLGGNAGLRVMELPGGGELSADPAYRQRMTSVEYAPDGTLATTAQDGCLRIYAPAGNLVLRAEFPSAADGQPAQCKGGEMGSLRISPDGKRLAFGRQDRDEVVVVDLPARTVQRVLKVGDPRQRNMCCATWSQDSRSLYLHGIWAGAGSTPMYRADLASGAITPLVVGQKRYTGMITLPDGDIVFSTDVPSLRRVKADGRLVADALPPNGDFGFDWVRFRVSADGGRASLPMRADGGDTRLFALLDKPDQAYRVATANETAALLPPLRDGPLQVQATLGDFGYRDGVRIGGRAVRLKDYQSLHSWAAAPDGKSVALGTQWSLALADAQGRVLWDRDLAAIVRQVNITRDGRWVVAALSDGTLRWFDLQGTERLGIFLEATGSEWVAWRPDGHYASSPQGDAYIGWLTNQGDAHAPSFYRASQFERQLYRPDLVAAALAAGIASKADGSEDLLKVLGAAAVPRVTIASIVPTAHGTLVVDVRVAANGRPVREVGLFVDGLPALQAAARAVEGAQQIALQRVYEIPLLAPGGRVRVEAETDGSIGIDETLPAVLPPVARSPPGRLWALTIGISEFDQLPGARLGGTLNDATVLAKVLQGLGGRHFTSVDVQMLTELSPVGPTRAKIVERLRALEKVVRPEDTLIVFIASHGMADAGEYYLVTKDSTSADVQRVAAAVERRERVPAGGVASMLSGTELALTLRRIPGRRLLVLDTCHAGQARSDTDPYVLVKRSAAAQVAVMSAASGDQLSAESATLGHGIFTYMLMRALRGEIGPARGPVTVQDVFDALKPEVIAEVQRMRAAPDTSAELRRSLGQTPSLLAIPPLQSAVLVMRP